MQSVQFAVQKDDDSEATTSLFNSLASFELAQKENIVSGKQ